MWLPLATLSTSHDVLLQVSNCLDLVVLIVDVGCRCCMCLHPIKRADWKCCGSTQSPTFLEMMWTWRQWPRALSVSQGLKWLDCAGRQSWQHFEKAWLTTLCRTLSANATLIVPEVAPGQLWHNCRLQAMQILKQEFRAIVNSNPTLYSSVSLLRDCRNGNFLAHLYSPTIQSVQHLQK